MADRSVPLASTANGVVENNASDYAGRCMTAASKVVLGVVKEVAKHYAANPRFDRIQQALINVHDELLEDRGDVVDPVVCHTDRVDQRCLHLPAIWAEYIRSK